MDKQGRRGQGRKQRGKAKATSWPHELESKTVEDPSVAKVDEAQLYKFLLNAYPDGNVVGFTARGRTVEGSRLGCVRFSSSFGTPGVVDIVPFAASAFDGMNKRPDWLWRTPYPTVVLQFRCGGDAGRANPASALVETTVNMFGMPRVAQDLGFRLRRRYPVQAVQVCTYADCCRLMEQDLKECGRSPLLRCGQCRLAYYCNVDCQRADWPTHRQNCCPPAGAQAELRVASRYVRAAITRDDELVDLLYALADVPASVHPADAYVIVYFRGDSAISVSTCAAACLQKLYKCLTKIRGGWRPDVVSLSALMARQETASEVTPCLGLGSGCPVHLD